MGPAVQRPTLSDVSGGGALVTRWVFQPAAFAVCRRLPPHVTPNRLSAASLAAGLLGCVGVVWAEGVLALVGCYFLLMLGYLLDCADGMLARLRTQSSPEGAVLDASCDLFVHAGFAIAIAVTVPLSSGMTALLVCAFCGPTVATFFRRSLVSGAEKPSRRSQRRGVRWAAVGAVALVIADYPVASGIMLALLTWSHEWLPPFIGMLTLLGAVIWVRLIVRTMG